METTTRFRRSTTIIAGIDSENACRACHGTGCDECDYTGEEPTEPFCDGEELARWDLVSFGVDQ